MSEMVILNGNRMKGRTAPVVYVEYLPEGADIGYMVPWIGGDYEIEEMCDLLAEMVEHHAPGHGQRAFEAARQQLETVDFQKEWMKVKRQQAAYRRWGGHPPAAVMIPDEVDPKAPWSLIVPEHDGLGDIKVYRVRPEITKDIPHPEEGRNAVRGEFGWIAKPTERQVQRARWNRGLMKARMRGMEERRVFF
jgi:hypothetical protein